MDGGPVDRQRKETTCEIEQEAIRVESEIVRVCDFLWWVSVVYI